MAGTLGIFLQSHPRQLMQHFTLDKSIIWFWIVKGELSWLGPWLGESVLEAKILNLLVWQAFSFQNRWIKVTVVFLWNSSEVCFCASYWAKAFWLELQFFGKRIKPCLFSAMWQFGPIFRAKKSRQQAERCCSMQLAYMHDVENPAFLDERIFQFGSVITGKEKTQWIS